jgi:hypothetical protein
MAISDDTRALVAAQLTTAWASRMGQEGQAARSAVGPAILEAYVRFYVDLARVPDQVGSIDEWIRAMREG